MELFGLFLPRRRAKCDAPTGSNMGVLLALRALKVAFMAPCQHETILLSYELDIAVQRDKLNSISSWHWLIVQLGQMSITS